MSSAFFSQELSVEEWTIAVKAATNFRPNLPLFNVLSNGTVWKISDDELKQFNIKRPLSKEVTRINNMMEVVDELGSDFDKTEAFALARDDEDIGVYINAVDGDFFAIDIDQFITGNNCLFDLYVKLTANKKFIKLLRAGDQFIPHQVEHYRQSGLRFLYIRREAAEQFVRYADHVSKKAMQTAKLEFITRQNIVMSQGTHTLKFLRRGLTDETVHYAFQFANYSKNIIFELKKLGPDHFPLSFFANLTQYDHSVSVAMLAGLISSQLNIDSEKSYQSIALAAMFHDISLADEDPKFSLEDPTDFNEEELKIFYSHPLRSAEIVSKIKSIDPGVLQAIKQHHTRIRGKSFPPKVVNQPINWVASLIGLADEIALTITKLCKNWESADRAALLKHLDEEVFPNFSKQMVYAARVALFPRAMITQKTPSNQGSGE